MLSKETAEQVVKILSEVYPSPKPQLEYSNSYEFLVAVILSAQCTDKRVNEVTKTLFQNYGTPEKMLTLSEEELQNIIKPCGLFRSKAKHILSASKTIIDCYNGQVPSEFDELIKLDGVGRKTANVVYAFAFNGDAMPVDTHVFRVSKRIGFASANTPFGVEKQICELISKSEWSKTHHYLIFHGRNVCTARKPKCSVCPISFECEKNGVNQ